MLTRARYQASKTIASVGFAVMRAATSNREEVCWTTLTPEEFHGYAKTLYPDAQLRGDVVYGRGWSIKLQIAKAL